MAERLAVSVPVSTLWAGPDAPRDVDAPAVANPPDVGAWTAAMDAGTRLGLHGRTLSQLLLGEPVEVMDERAGWAQVVAPWQPFSGDERGYPGWVPLAHLDEPAETSQHTAAVMRPVASLVVDGAATADVSWATVLPLLEQDAELARVALPGGATGSLLRTDVAVREPGIPVEFQPQQMLAGARQFVGLRYLWGGTCGWGLDCSGLVHLGFRLQGVVVPRDADDQQLAAAPVEIDAVEGGDLYFFGHSGAGIHHVGLVTGPNQMLHATEGADRVEEAPLDAERRETLRAAGRFPATRPRPSRPFRPAAAVSGPPPAGSSPPPGHGGPWPGSPPS